MRLRKPFLSGHSPLRATFLLAQHFPQSSIPLRTGFPSRLHTLCTECPQCGIPRGQCVPEGNILLRAAVPSGFIATRIAFPSELCSFRTAFPSGQHSPREMFSLTHCPLRKCFPQDRAPLRTGFSSEHHFPQSCILIWTVFLSAQHHPQ